MLTVSELMEYYKMTKTREYDVLTEEDKNIVENNINFAIYCAKKRFRKVYTMFTMDELISDCYFGMCQAVRTFDADKGKFTTHSKQWCDSIMNLTNNFIIKVPQRLLGKYIPPTCEPIYFEHIKEEAENIKEEIENNENNWHASFLGFLKEHGSEKAFIIAKESLKNKNHRKIREQLNMSKVAYTEARKNLRETFKKWHSELSEPFNIKGVDTNTE